MRGGEGALFSERFREVAGRCAYFSEPRTNLSKNRVVGRFSFDE